MKVSRFNKGHQKLSTQGQQARRSSTQAKPPLTTSRKTPSSTTRSEVKSNERDNARRCFKCQGIGHMASECPSRRNVVIREVSDGEEEFDENVDPVWDAEEIEEYPDEGELFVIRKSVKRDTGERGESKGKYFPHQMHSRKKSLLGDQRKLHQRHVEDVGRKLKLPIEAHPHPYRLQWLNKESDV
ncbi:hypothetical protein MLD38_005166 [Melastoma candidum]|uniref:Uncharacterized protein n=1 Tax=Melastoma candidum TaxID=119954 RepID=A0ACB9S806_9MYRT|nr:hypothetical protein MLD38_005166 [Melastoma candidum]